MRRQHPQAKTPQLLLTGIHWEDRWEVTVGAGVT